MAKYFDIRNSEIREMSDSLYQDWINSDNPKRHFWKPLPKKPNFDKKTQREPVFLNKKWVVDDKTEDDYVKIWSNSFQFFAEFTPEEQTTIIMSSDIQIKTFRYLLALRKEPIFSNEPFIVGFLTYLIFFNVISEERKVQILSIENL